MIKANYSRIIFQKNFNRYSAELVRTRFASLRSASLRSFVPKGRGFRPHPVGLPRPLGGNCSTRLSLRVGAYAPTLSGMPCGAFFS